MLQKADRLAFLLGATMSIANAQNFTLSVTGSQALPTGPITDPANISAGADAQGNQYLLINGPTSGCQPVGTPPTFCVPIWSSYLVKMNPSSAQVLFQRTLPWQPTVMAVDPAGNIYVAGANEVEKLAADGTTVLHKMTIGGPNLSITAITVDTAGRLYLAGSVTAGDLPATSGAFQQNPTNGSSGGFVARLTAAAGIDYATYLGDGAPRTSGLAVDATGAAFVLWDTDSIAFPTTAGAAFPSGGSYLARLTADGSGLIYTTHVGAGNGYLLAADSAGYAVVVLDNPGAPGLTVTRFNPQGTGVVFSRSLPGASTGGLALDAAGNTYFYESLLASSANFPVKNSITACGVSPQNGLTVLDSRGTILQSTYLPGPPPPEGSVLGDPLGLLVLPDSSVDLFTGSVNGSLILTHMAQNPNAQTVPLGCVGNAASYNPGVSPGELVSLFGAGLGPAAGTVAPASVTAGFPTEVANVKVTFNGLPAPLLYVQDGQVNAVVPWPLPANGTADVCVTYNEAPANCLTTSVSPASPGVFMLDGRYAVALNQDGTLNSASHPAAPGSVVAIFATGLGKLDPLPADGSIVGFPLPRNVLAIGMFAYPNLSNVEEPVTLTYAGPAPGAVAGFSQINFLIDVNASGPYAAGLLVGPPGSQAQSNAFFIHVGSN